MFLLRNKRITSQNYLQNPILLGAQPNPIMTASETTVLNIFFFFFRENKT